MTCNHVRSGVCQSCWEEYEAQQAKEIAPSVVTEEEVTSLGSRIFGAFVKVAVTGCILKMLMLYFGNS